MTSVAPEASPNHPPNHNHSGNHNHNDNDKSHDNGNQKDWTLMLDDLQELIQEKVSLGWTIVDRNCIGCDARPLVQPPPKPDSHTEGIPFCVKCKSHVITHVDMLNHVQELEDKHGDSWVTGSILMDLASPTNSFEEKDDAHDDDHLKEDPIQQSKQQALEIESNNVEDTHLNSTIHSQEQENDQFRIHQLRLASQTRLQKEELLRNQRMEQMKKEEESRKLLRLQQQMEEIRIHEEQKMNQTDFRRQQLQKEEQSKLTKDVQLRSLQQEELLQQIMSNSSLPPSASASASASTPSSASAKALEDRYMAMIHDAKIKGEQEAKMEKYFLQVNDATMDLQGNPLFPLTTSTPPSSHIPSPPKSANIPLLSFMKQVNNQLTPEEEMKIRFDEEEALQQRQQERDRLRLVNQRIENLRQQKLTDQQQRHLQLQQQQQHQQQQQLQLQQQKQTSLELLKRQAKSAQAQKQIAMQAALDAIAKKDQNQDAQQMLQLEEAAKHAHQKAEKATTLADSAMTHLSDIQKKVFHNQVGQAALSVQVELEDVMAEQSGLPTPVANPNNISSSPSPQFSISSLGKLADLKVGEDMKQYQKATLALESLQNANAPTAHLSSSITSSKPLTPEEWEFLRGASRKKISKMMLDGWSMATDYCKGNQCKFSPLMVKNGVTECPTCGGTGTGLDGTYVNDPTKGIPAPIKPTLSLSQAAPLTKVTSSTTSAKSISSVPVPVATNAEETLKPSLTIDTSAPPTDTPPQVLVDTTETPTPKATETDKIAIMSKLELQKASEDMKRDPNAPLKLVNITSDFDPAVTIPSKALTADEWEFLRGASRKKIFKLMVDGWSMATDYCKGQQCKFSPLMVKNGETQCAVCGGSGSGLDGAYTNDPNKGKPDPRLWKDRQKLEEQERLQKEIEQMKLDTARRKKEEGEFKMKLELEANEKKKTEELKRLQESLLKEKVDAEVKKREEEIKEDLKKTEEFVRAKNHNVNDEIQRNAERARLVNERKRFADIVKEVKKIDDVRKRQEEEDAKSVDSRRSRVSFRSSRSRSSQLKVSKIDDGDDASVGGVSIQFPPDFDYDDENAIRQVIAMAKLQKKTPRSPHESDPPMSISFINKEGSSNGPPSPIALDSPRKRNYLPRSGNRTPRTPRLPPVSVNSVSSYSSSLLRDHSKAMENPAITSSTNEDFDDGVSHISMGDNTEHQNFTPKSTLSERDSRRERILSKLNSPRASSPSPRKSSRRSPRSSSLTRVSSRRSNNTEANGGSSATPLSVTTTRRSSRLRNSESGSVTSASSRKSALGDILSKIENAKAQLVKKSDGEMEI